jgi:SM-20-related protein
VVDGALPEDIYNGLNQYLDELIHADKLRRAGIGSLSQFEINNRVRGDEIHWLKRDDQQPDMLKFFEFVETLIDKLNREFFLSLSDFEFHFAHYPPGAHYGPHVDQFRGRNNRQISFILYLNDHWQEGHGGELSVITEQESIIIPPIGNRLVLFRSDIILHEVLTTNASRRSLTGWLLNNPVGLGFLG